MTAMTHAKNASHETPLEVPLAVDLDGTLIRSDLLEETALLLLKKNPLYAFLMLVWLLKSRAVLKREIAVRIELDAARLPFHETVLDFLRREKAKGRTIVLATASDILLAEKVAAHLGLFDEVMGSDGVRNLKSEQKRDALVEKYPNGFAYIGDSNADQPLFRAAAESLVVVKKADGDRAYAGGKFSFVHVFVEPKSILRPLVKALRPHQWAKNLLVFVPAGLAHKATDVDTLVQSAVAFIAFSLLASSVYVVNDLLDINADRHHHRKRLRPFASGTLPIRMGIVLAPLLIAAAVVPAMFLPSSFLLVLGGYFVTTVAYSFVLKRIAIVDVLTLAALYTVRIVAGAEATGITVSSWLQGFSLFIFLSLAFIKRFTELKALLAEGKEDTVGRGYRTSDLPQVGSLGSAAGYVAVLILALYVSSSDVTRLYQTPVMLWGMIPLFLFWISRLWILAGRGEMHDDPVVFAVKDPASYVTAFLLLTVVALAV